MHTELSDLIGRLRFIFEYSRKTIRGDKESMIEQNLVTVKVQW